MVTILDNVTNRNNITYLYYCRIIPTLHYGHRMLSQKQVIMGMDYLHEMV